MNVKNVVILDADDVLLSYTEALHAFLRKHYNIVPPNALPSHLGYAEWLQRTEKEVDNFVMHFNERSWEFGTIGAMPGAKEAIDAFIENNIELIVVTKCGTGGSAQPLRRACLVNHFGDVFTDIKILEYHESKREAFRQIRDTYNVLGVVDDNVDNIKTSLSLGLPSILFWSTQNAEHADDFETVWTWETAQKVILDNLHTPE